MTTLRRTIVTLLGALLLAGVTGTVAHAEDGFRFWAYYQWTSGHWAFASKAPSGITPADGSVEGWRYAVGGKPRTPRAGGDFDAICGPTPAETGKKRVAVVIDPGTAEDSADKTTPPAPSGTCVVADPKATGAQVLAAAAQVRIEKGLTCGIAGYPATGCADPVKNIQVPATEEPVQLEIKPAAGAAKPAATPVSPPAATPTSSSSEDESTPWGPIIAGVILIAALGTGGLVLSRRRTANQI